MRRRALKTKEERILQIINDIAEEMNFENHTKAELRDVVNYLSDEFSIFREKISADRMELGVELLKLSTKAMKL